MVCGGLNSKDDLTTACYTYNYAADKWFANRLFFTKLLYICILTFSRVQSGNLTIGRKFIGSAYSPSVGLVIAGGSVMDSNKITDLVEVTTDGVVFKTTVIPKLPVATLFPCLVFTDGKTLLSLGGDDGRVSDRAFRFQLGSRDWEELHRMPTPRWGL